MRLRTRFDKCAKLHCRQTVPPADRWQGCARGEVRRVGLVGLHDSALHVRHIQRERRPAPAVVEQGYAAEPGRVVRRQRREGPAPCRQAAPCFLRGTWLARPGGGCSDK